jgi:hypothetical protein
MTFFHYQCVSRDVAKESNNQGYPEFATSKAYPILVVAKINS